MSGSSLEGRVVAVPGAGGALFLTVTSALAFPSVENGQPASAASTSSWKRPGSTPGTAARASSDDATMR